MSLSKHTPYLRQAIALACSAVEKGNHPFGALLLMEGGIVLKSENSIHSDGDVTRHAELNLISSACKKFTTSELSRAVLYSSTEPCAMCAGAIYWSGIRHVVFGSSTNTLESIAGNGLRVSCRQVLGTAVDFVCIEGPCLEEEANALHEGYW